MKKILKSIGVAALLATGTLHAQFATYTNLISPQTVNGSVTGAWVQINVSLPPQYFQVLSGPITNAPNYVTNIVGSTTNIYNTVTNAQATAFIFSIAGPSNGIGCGFPTNYPTGTNSAIARFNLQNLTFPMWYAPVVTTTNALPVGVLKQQ